MDGLGLMGTMYMGTKDGLDEWIISGGCHLGKVKKCNMFIQRVADTQVNATNDLRNTIQISVIELQFEHSSRPILSSLDPTSGL